MLNYFYGYLAFVFGSLFYILLKIRDYKATIKANPSLKVSYSFKALFNDEWVNIALMYLGGVALVWLFPKLVGGSTVELKTSSGLTLLNLSVKAACVPIYFFFGYSGNSALFAFFGKYKKTILSQVGADETDKP